MELSRGQKVPLKGNSLEVALSLSGPASYDLSCFGVDAGEKLSDDRYFVFYNQTSSPEGAIKILGAAGNPVRFGLDLSRLPEKIQKLVFVATIEGAGSMRDLREGVLEIFSGSSLARFAFSGRDFQDEKAVMVAEIYRKGEWRLGAVGQGFNGGLSALLAHFGGEEVKEVEPVTGQPKAGRSIELTKGDQPVTIEKTSRIIASATWDGTANYELYALVLTSSGHEVHVATFPADGIPALLDYGNGAVRHLGDVGRGSHGTKKASLEIRPSLDIVAVVPVIYCAQSNGVGSFARYRVSLLIEDQNGAEVTIRSRQPSENWLVYSWVPGIIRNTPNGIEIEALDLYSEARSKNRPKLLIVPNGNVKIEVDAGPINKYM